MAKHVYQWYLKEQSLTFIPLSSVVTLPTCLIPLTDVILEGTRTGNLHVSYKLEILLAITLWLYICSFHFSKKKCFHIFTTKTYSSNENGSFRSSQTQQLRTFPHSLSHKLLAHLLLTQLSGITTTFSLSS